MAAKSEWAKLPIRWIHEGALVDFRGRSTRPSSRLFLHLVQPEVDAPALRNESLAALKLFLVLCCRADFSTGMAKVTYTELCKLGVMSRAVVARSLLRLENAGLIARETRALKSGSLIKIEKWNDDYGWGKIPKLWLYDGNLGRMLRLSEFNFTQLSFHAMKIYLAILAFRDRRGIATISYDRLASYTGVPRHHIADTITQLYAMELVSFRPGEFHNEHQFDRTNRYLVRGFDTRWPALEEEDKPPVRSAAAPQRPSQENVASALEFVKPSEN
ncbi:MULTISPECIES: hypothetical protein [Pseudomonas]|uniref:Uncharacterized protein n=2 Tax=Pseudomonas TaxID=286 RepID=A0A0D1MWU3_PSEPU|nr:MULTISPECIES: hypothetical protein [Pseudomonas]KIU53304.1 hypothetical protein QV12_05970 [Pseudomonas putida]MCP8348668.1 MarR family transcriptional regulator [Pseudomonas sp. FBF18]MDU9392835.1 MarR family transcriptional regulator [Pseudomonas sp. zfem002]NNJ16752.1 MarR family transcriptional regulator [Pseudomonas bharatica CSV86]OLS61575.1 hypothetical protein PSEMO_35040 [Pseudomonas putida]